MRLEKFVWTAVAIGAAICIGTSPLSATPGATKPPAVKTQSKPTTHGSPKLTSKTSSPKTTVSHGQSAAQAPKTTTTKGPKTTTQAAKTTTKSTKTTTKSTKTTTKSAKATTTKTKGNPHKQPTETTTTAGGTTTGGTDGTTPTTDPTVPLTKAQQLLTKNTKLQTKLQTRLGTQLPDGVSLIDAASGFRNLGQFVAAVNVSNNLGIPFADLKASMTGMNIDGTPIEVPEGTTAPAALSLGQSIQALKGMDSTTATQTANTATTQANAEISSTTSGKH